MAGKPARGGHFKIQRPNRKVRPILKKRILQIVSVAQEFKRKIKSVKLICNVPSGGFEPPILAEHGPKPCASANFATRAFYKYYSKLFYSF